ncbi:MAG: UTP--glucose-1-phosphate uridylyltransferase GalU [Synergistaceae bacterium]
MEEFKTIKKAVFPVAGLGTRFLPVTKNIPKEMLPLIDKPLIHHGVNEAIASGCNEVVFVTGTGKESIKSYFSHSIELEDTLEKSGKTEFLNIVKNIPELAEFRYVFQEKPLGLGHAVLCAKEYCIDNYFALILPDDVMIANPTVLTQLDKIRSKYNGSVLSLERIPMSQTSRYGIVDAEQIDENVYKIKGLVEKPNPDVAPSDLAIMGRYILSPSIFKHLESINCGKGGEYQLTDAISSLLHEEPVYACIYEGERHDCGVIEGWIKATIINALRDSRYRDIAIDAFIDEIIKK